MPLNLKISTKWNWFEGRLATCCVCLVFGLLKFRLQQLESEGSRSHYKPVLQQATMWTGYLLQYRRRMPRHTPTSLFHCCPSWGSPRLERNHSERVWYDAWSKPPASRLWIKSNLSHKTSSTRLRPRQIKIDSEHFHEDIVNLSALINYKANFSSPSEDFHTNLQMAKMGRSSSSAKEKYSKPFF